MSTSVPRDGRRAPMKAHTKIATIAGWALYVVSVVVFEGFFLALTGQASEVLV
jgi:hypothetical protein